MNAIESSGLGKQFGNIAALKDLSLAIESNKITGLIGPNGAGKTTLLKLIAGYLRPTTGEIRVYGENPFNNLRVASSLVFIDDNLALPQSLAIGELLDAAGEFYANWDQELARRLFDYFELDSHQIYKNLSKGKKSTFTMIIGLATRCPLTIFDEPTTGMDAAVRRDFYRALLKDYMQKPRTIIFSSHLLAEIEGVLEDVLLINKGNKLLHLPVAELREYALGLRGKGLDHFIGKRKVLFREPFGRDGEYAVVENSFDSGQVEAVRIAGVEVTPVNTADLCVYLTAKNKGGIDDVFDRE